MIADTVYPKYLSPNVSYIIFQYISEQPHEVGMIYLFRGGKGDLSIVERPFAPHLNVQMFTSTLEKLIILLHRLRKTASHFLPFQEEEVI